MMDLATRLNRFLLGAAAIASTAPGVANAQWVSQSLELTEGWNAVYLHVDASHTTLDEMVVDQSLGDDILSVWRWEPTTSTVQYLTSPDDPTTSDSNWTMWDGSGVGESLSSFLGNAAYLIQVADGVADFTWDIVGTPVPPVYRWTSSGQNFIGFPTAADSSGAYPNFDAFLAEAPDLYDFADIFHYDVAETPIELGSLSGREVERGAAYWVYADGIYNRYFGSFSVTLQDRSGLHFGSLLTQYRIQIQNHTDEPLEVSLSWASSDPNLHKPDTEAELAGLAPLIIRGSLQADLTYPATDFTASHVETISLEAFGDVDSKKELALGLDRSLLEGDDGDVSGGVLNFRDTTKEFTSIDVPVTAEKTSLAGLWVGATSIELVSDDVPFYETETDDAGNEQIVYDDNEAPVLDLRYYEYTVDSEGVLSPKFTTNGEVIRAYYQFSTTDEGELLVVTDENGDPEFDLSFYVTDDDGAIARDDSGAPSYSDAVNTEVARPFNMRLIIHANAEGVTQLLQRIYYGYAKVFDKVEDAEVITNILVNRELEDDGVTSVFEEDFMAAARRISSVHFPWTEWNVPWVLEGVFGEGTINTDSEGIFLNYDDHASNPFLHTYHPDHDNLDSDFSATQAIGVESYSVRRNLALTFGTASDDFSGRTANAGVLTGTYGEIIELIGKGEFIKEFSIQGPFTLNRVTDIDTLNVIEQPLSE